MSNGTNENPQASVERVRQEVERWIDAARLAGERTLEAIGLTPLSRSLLPAIDVFETPTAVEVWIDVPGLTTNAVQLSATATQLTIKSSRPAPVELEGKYTLRERPVGDCERTITLPAAVNADQIQAELRDGMLRVTMPKTVHHEARTVPVNVMNRQGVSPFA